MLITRIRACTCGLSIGSLSCSGQPLTVISDGNINMCLKCVHYAACHCAPLGGWGMACCSYHSAKAGKVHGFFIRALQCLQHNAQLPHDCQAVVLLAASHSMRSAVSRAPIMTSGTPLPGRELAPVKYKPLTFSSFTAGLNRASWLSP